MAQSEAEEKSLFPGLEGGVREHNYCYFRQPDTSLYKGWEKHHWNGWITINPWPGFSLGGLSGWGDIFSVLSPLTGWMGRRGGLQLIGRLL